MKNFKKVITLASAIMTAVSAMSISAMAAETPAVGFENGSHAASVANPLTRSNDTYNNETSHWAEAYINTMTENNIMEGYSDGSLYPEQNVTRAEYAKMFSLSAGLNTEIESSVSFTDVQENNWAYKYVRAMQDHIPSVSTSKFEPDQYLTRIDMVMSLSYFNIDSNTISGDQFTDTASLSSLQKKYLNYAVDNKYINGYSDSTFKPNGSITRAEAAAFLSRVFFSDNANIQDQVIRTAEKTEANKKLISSGMRGYTLKVYNNLREANDGILITNDIQYPLRVDFSNYTDKNSEFVMKVFYDYKEVTFKLNENYSSTYKFNLDSMETIKLPLYIDDNIKLDDNLHKLTVAFFADADSHVADADAETDFYGICLDYEIKKPNASNNFDNVPEYSDCTVLKNIQYSGILINDDAAPSETKALFLPDNMLKCKKGESIELSSYMGNIDKTTSDYLMILLYDWRQVLINDTNIFCNVKEGLAYNRFSLSVPDEVGKYEICAICVSNPFTHVDDRDFAPQYSNRFTIDVN